MNQTTVRLKDIIAPHFWKTFNSKVRHQIDKGGRGSTKTSKNCLKVNYHCLGEEKCSAVVIRKYQNTLRNSAYKEIKRAFKRLHCEENIDYIANVSPLQVKLKNGNNIYFCGADDYEKLKGMIDEDRPIKIVLFMELTEFDGEEELQQITATFARGNIDWFINLYEYNPPKSRYHWVNVWEEKMSSRDDVLVTHSDYRTVPRDWLGLLVDEAEQLLKIDEKRYNWIYLGEVIGMEGNIYNLDLFKYRPVNYLEENKLKILYVDIVVDSGHQSSATTFMAYGYATDGNWYLLDIYYYSPKEKAVKKAPSDYSKDLFNFEMYIIKKYATSLDVETIDSAEGGLRNQFFKDYGRRLHGVDKGNKTNAKELLIEYTIDFLTLGKFFILDTPNNKIFTKEVKEYRWKEGSVEKGKPEPDKTDKEFQSSELYYNTHSKDNAYFYGDHTCDGFQYWVKDNLQKLGLKY